MYRNRTIDLARGFTVFFIAPIHTVLLFSKPYVYNTFFGQFLTFIAEDVGAQVFMTAMGVSFVLSKHNDLRSVFTKSLWMLLLGYGLNFVKFVVPAVFNLLPAGVYTELQVQRNCCGYLKMLLTGDILQFAGIALLVMYAVSRLPRFPLWALIFAGIICFVSPLLFDLHSKNFCLNYLSELLAGQPPRVFFPVFPWLIYPLIGLTIGYYLKQGKPLLFGYGMLIGFTLMFISCAQWMPYAKEFGASFYRTYPSGSLYHIGILLIWLYLMNWVAVNGAQHHPLLCKCLSFLSRHITLIYCIQWIIVCWSLPFFGFRTLGLAWSVVLAVSITMFTLLYTAIFLFLRRIFRYER